MTSGLSQQAAVAARVERLVERAMALAIDEHDDDIAVARLAWLAQDDHAAVEEAGEACLGTRRLAWSSAAGPSGCWLGSATTILPLDQLAAPVLVRPGSRALGEPPVARPARSVARRPLPSMQSQAMVGYGERSAIQAGIGGRADLEWATANMSTEVGDLDAALAALYQLPLEQFVATRDQLARRASGPPATGPPPARSPACGGRR